MSGGRGGSDSPVVLTSGSSALGRAAALQLAAHGLPLVLGVRSVERGNEVQDEVLSLNPGARVDVLRLDLADLTSVLEFSAEYAQRFPGWRALVANAGVTMAPTRRLTSDGFELHLGVNSLAHFALTGLLLPFAAPAARVVTVTSPAARFGRIVFHDLRFDHGYRPFRAYAASMRANLLFARELQRRSERDDLGVLSVAVHPGLGVALDGLSGPLGAAGRTRDYAAAAVPIVAAVTDPDLSGGELLAPRRRGGTVEAVPVTPPRIRNEDVVAPRLWRLAGQLTRVVW
ncbi:SDR family NAD(P)-dependent oxidoreductase [Naasia sp. SYSU D00948]|uniref:SDR family NAD(P)-dependent oxidoreductase n=1 Tax=Naasia sp. SYSU D00948 TaxID=2817379 RepID=UPI001B303FA5|nr:SDR family NAD(P)-dependent oxidoreductase [Naasia sp. SYSU D00948]